jgi:hypothetical protein
MNREAKIKQMALEAGFDLAGIANLRTPPPDLKRLDDWIQQGYHATMEWLPKQRDKRLDPVVEAFQVGGRRAQVGDAGQVEAGFQRHLLNFGFPVHSPMIFTKTRFFLRPSNSA